MGLHNLDRIFIEKLDRVLPAHWSRGNPIDIIGDADAARYCDALACLDRNAKDGLLIARPWQR